MTAPPLPALSDPDRRSAHRAVGGRKGRPAPAETQRRQEALLDMATQIFCRDGYNAATVDRIAEAAGISKRTVYLWHADKMALFMRCLERIRLRMPMPQPADGTDVETGLVQYARTMLLYILEPVPLALMKLLHREGRQFPEIAHSVSAGFNAAVFEPLAHYLADQKAAGRIAVDDPQAAAILFSTMMLGDLERRVAYQLDLPTADEIDRHARMIARVFLHGTAARTSAAVVPLRRA